LCQDKRTEKSIYLLKYFSLDALITNLGAGASTKPACRDSTAQAGFSFLTSHSSILLTLIFICPLKGKDKRSGAAVIKKLHSL
jgi:hypothetical protein